MQVLQADERPQGPGEDDCTEEEDRHAHDGPDSLHGPEPQEDEEDTEEQAHAPRGLVTTGEVEPVAVVALVAATGWALLAARSTIRRQKQAQIELLPTQPGDVGSAGRSDRPPAGARALSEEYLIAYAPGELAWLRTRVDAALASREAYDDRIAPLLRELAVARGARAGRRIDPDALVDIGPHLPGEDGLSLLAHMAQSNQRIQRLLITGDRSQDVFMRAINEGKTTID